MRGMGWLAAVAALGLLGSGTALGDTAAEPEGMGDEAPAIIDTLDRGEEAETPEEVEAAPVGEEPADELDDVEIEVEVVGKREGLLSISPAPGEQVIEVTAQQIADAGAATVMDVLDLTPSVFVRHQGARYESRLSIRGMTPRLVLLDGLPVAREGTSGPGGGAGGAEAAFAGRILYTMPAELIERIDVIRSANTIVYGPSAAAGAVVNIVTREPEVGERLAATAHYGSYDNRRAFVDASVNDGRLAFFVLGGMDAAGSHLPLGEKRFKNVFGKISYDYPDGSRLLLDLFSLEGRRTLDLSQDFSIVPARYWQIDPWKERFANIVYSRAVSEEATLDLVFYQRDRDFETNQYTNDTFGVVSMNWMEKENDKGIDLRYSLRRDSGALTRAGLQWSQLSSDTVQTQFRGPTGPFPTPRVTTVFQEQDTYSAFLNHVVPLRHDLRGSVGARYDNMQGYSPDVTFSLGLEATASPRTTWYLNVGTGVEHPLPTAADVVSEVDPQEARSLSAETGWTVRPDDVSRVTTALFWVKTKDARVLYNDPPGTIGPLAWRSKAEDLTTTGLELIYDRRVTDDVTVFANYTYLVERLSNQNEPAVPGPDYPFAAKPPRSIAAAGVRANVGDARVAVNARYTSDYFAQSRLMQTAESVDSYLVLDMKVSRPVGDGEMSLLVDNLLDASYETMPAFPRPGRNYLLSYRCGF